MVPTSVMPKLRAAAPSMPLLRRPVVRRSLRLGRAERRGAWKGVRSRHVEITEKGFSCETSLVKSAGSVGSSVSGKGTVVMLGTWEKMGLETPA